MKATAISALLALMLAIAQVQADVRINQIQFVGSHNSYKQSMSGFYRAVLGLIDVDAAKSLDYEHARCKISSTSACESLNWMCSISRSL